MKLLALVRDSWIPKTYLAVLAFVLVLAMGGLAIIFFYALLLNPRH